MKDHESQAGLVLQQLVYAGLDMVRAAVPLDLCAHLHVMEGSGPQLYLRHPDLSSMEASEAFQLFVALHDALLSDGRPDGPRGYSSALVTSSTERSRRLWVAGRRGAELDDHQRGLLERLLSAIADAHALVESSVVRATERDLVEISVDVGDTSVHARVTVGVPGFQAVGHGDAAAPMRAVALGVLDAFDPGFKLRHVGEDEVSGERTVLVLVEKPTGSRAVGAALIDNDHLRATALATLAAVDDLARGPSTATVPPP